MVRQDCTSPLSGQPENGTFPRNGQEEVSQTPSGGHSLVVSFLVKPPAKDYESVANHLESNAAKWFR